jgi:hypothetical protein
MSPASESGKNAPDILPVRADIEVSVTRHALMSMEKTRKPAINHIPDFRVIEKATERYQVRHAYFRRKLAAWICAFVHAASSSHVLNLYTPEGNQRPRRGLNLNMELFHRSAAAGDNPGTLPTTLMGFSSQPNPSSRTVSLADVSFIFRNHTEFRMQNPESRIIKRIFDGKAKQAPFSFWIHLSRRSPPP